MCLCDHHDGGLLVHGGAALGHHRPPPGPPLPSVWHHEVPRREWSSRRVVCSEGTNPCSQQDVICPLCLPGVHAVLEGHQPAVRGGADGGRGRGALEPSQTHCPEGAALCRCAPSAVSGLCIHLELQNTTNTTDPIRQIRRDKIK